MNNLSVEMQLPDKYARNSAKAKNRLRRLRIGLVLCLITAAAHAQDPLVKQCEEKFPPGGARAQCVTPWLDGIVMRESAAAALEAAESLVRSGVMNVNDCHIMGHAVGHSSWRKEGDLARAFNACSPKCIQGCLHGSVEAFMIDGPPAETTPARVRAFCATMADRVKRRQCLHGLGHGVMHQHRKDLKTATGACESLTGVDAALCLGGLWMQWAHFRIHLGTEAYARIAPSMCEGVRDELLPECARAVGGGAMFASSHNAARAAEICLLLPSIQYADCRRGVDYEVRLIRGGLEGAHGH
jgi:hypothetical protein